MLPKNCGGAGNENPSHSRVGNTPGDLIPVASRPRFGCLEGPTGLLEPIGAY
jgi:hypothetical protein